MTTPAEQLHTFLEKLTPPNNRVVVRWTDESRILPDQDQDSFTVGPISYVILTAKIEDEVTQTRIDHISIDEVRRIMRQFPVDPLFRSDNIGR